MVGKLSIGGIAVVGLSLITTAVLLVHYSGQVDSTENKIDEPAAKTVDTECPYYLPPVAIEFENHRELGELFNWLDKYISSIVDDKSRLSISANMLYRNEIVWSGNYGRLNKQSEEKPTQDTIYRIGSIAKIFPVLFMFKLHEEGKLNIYDPVKKYAPDFNIRRIFDSKSEITLIDIASQISGLPESLQYDPKTDHPVVWKGGSLNQALRLLKSHFLVAEPRTICSYSSVAYPLLAEILARNFTDDGNFKTWAKKNILDPLGLENTGFDFTDDVKNKMATGYYDNGTEAPLIDIGWYGPTGNYFSSAGDLAKLSTFLLKGSSQKILRHETITEMLRPRMVCHPGYFSTYTGSPFEINKLHSYLVIGKIGAFDGYSGTLEMVPDLDLSFNYVMAGGWNENLARNVTNKAIPVFRDALRRQAPQLNSTPNPEKYVGIFTLDGGQWKNITADERGVLYMTDLQETAVLSYVSKDVFTLVNLDKDYPCDLGSMFRLDVHNGAVLNFKELRKNKYHSFMYFRRNIFVPQSGVFRRVD